MATERSVLTSTLQPRDLLNTCSELYAVIPFSELCVRSETPPTAKGIAADGDSSEGRFLFVTEPSRFVNLVVFKHRED